MNVRITDFNQELLKRLPGYPLGFTDKNKAKKLSVGETVKIYYTIFEKESNDKLFAFGKIKYDFLHKKFLIRLNDAILNWNNNNKNFILELNEDGSYQYYQALEYQESKVKNIYKECKKILDTQNYILFYQKIMDLFYDNEIQLFEDELKYIKTRLNNYVNCNIDLIIDILNWNNKQSNAIINNVQSLSNDIENIIANYSDYLKCNNINIQIKKEKNVIISVQVPIDN